MNFLFLLHTDLDFMIAKVIKYISHKMLLRGMLFGMIDA